MKNSVCYTLTMIAWTVNTLVLLDFGLGACGYNFLNNVGFIQQNFQMFQYLVLITSLWNLYLYIMHFRGQKGCSEKKCQF